MKILRCMLQARVFLLVITVALWSIVGVAYSSGVEFEKTTAFPETEKLARFNRLKRALPEGLGEAVARSMESSDRLSLSAYEVIDSGRALVASLAFVGTVGCIANFIGPIRRRIWVESPAVQQGVAAAGAAPRN